jgi:ABC-type branched-subunit amino acid transport system ATPase component
LDLVGLAAATDTLTANLSYGQQKLLSIACLLGAGASTLLLDEPVAGLHPEMSATILRVLQELRKAGKSIIFVEHNVDAIRQIAEEVVVMDQGRIIAQGTPVEVLARHEIAEAYLA